MVGVSFKLTGSKELENAFRQLPKATSKSVLKRALKNAAAPTLAAAKSNAPRATGNLQQALSIRAVLVKSQSTTDASPGAARMYVGATTPQGSHAHLLEFGTSKMAAQPFMRPAWNATRNEVLGSFTGEVWEALVKSARTLARKAEKGTLSKTAQRALSS